MRLLILISAWIALSLASDVKNNTLLVKEGSNVTLIFDLELGVKASGCYCKSPSSDFGQVFPNLWTPDKKMFGLAVEENQCGATIVNFNSADRGSWVCNIGYQNGTVIQQKLFTRSIDVFVPPKSVDLEVDSLNISSNDPKPIPVRCSSDFSNPAPEFIWLINHVPIVQPHLSAMNLSKDRWEVTLFYAPNVSHNESTLTCSVVQPGLEKPLHASVPILFHVSAEDSIQEERVFTHTLISAVGGLIVVLVIVITPLVVMVKYRGNVCHRTKDVGDTEEGQEERPKGKKFIAWFFSKKIKHMKLATEVKEAEGQELEGREKKSDTEETELEKKVKTETLEKEPEEFQNAEAPEEPEAEVKDEKTVLPDTTMDSCSIELKISDGNAEMKSPRYTPV